MRGQQLRLMTFIALGLGLLVLLVERPWSRRGSGDGRDLYPDVKIDAIDRIEVINRQDTVNLVKRDPIWMIDSKYPLPADTATIHRALEAVDKFQTDQLASKNPSKFGLFEVDSTGAKVKLFAKDKTAAEFLLGKSTPEGGTYFRPAGKDEVYSSPDRVRSLFVRNARAWWDRKVFSMETTEVSKLVVEHGDTTAVFEKSADGKWSLTRPDSFEVQPERLEPLLQGICKLVANAFPDSAVTLEQAGLAGRPMLRVNAQRIDGSGIELQVGTQNANGLYHAKASDRDWIYMIAKYRVDPYYENLATLKAAPAPPGAPGAPSPGGSMPGASFPGEPPGGAPPAGVGGSGG